MYNKIILFTFNKYNDYFSYFYIIYSYEYLEGIIMLNKIKYTIREIICTIDKDTYIIADLKKSNIENIFLSNFISQR